MRNRTRLSIAGLVTLAFGSWCQGAMAEDEVTSDSSPLVEQKASLPRLNPLGAKAVSDDALSSRRGGTKILSTQDLKGVVADTKVSEVQTGSNVVNGGALTGSAGLPMVIQNSGNGVLIQNATIVNVHMQ
jgi:hypothetical protein